MQTIALCFLINNRDRDGPVLPKAHASPLFKAMYTHPGLRLYAFYTGGDHQVNRVDPEFAAHAVTCATTTPTKYGSPSVVMAMKDLLDCAYSNSNNIAFLFLSESCCPLWNPAVIHEVLTNRVRTSWFSKWTSNGVQAQRRVDMLPPSLKRANISRSWILTGQQCSLSRMDAKILLESLGPLIMNRIPKNRMLNQTIWGLDEAAFITILAMKERPMIRSHEGPVLANWSQPEGSSPKEYRDPLTEEDLFTLLATDALFFRKIQANHTQFADATSCQVFASRKIADWDVTHHKKGSTYHLNEVQKRMRTFPRRHIIYYLKHAWKLSPFK